MLLFYIAFMSNSFIFLCLDWLRRLDGQLDWMSRLNDHLDWMRLAGQLDWLSRLDGQIDWLVIWTG